MCKITVWIMLWCRIHFFLSFLTFVKKYFTVFLLLMLRKSVPCTPLHKKLTDYAPQIDTTCFKWPTLSVICWHPRTGVSLSPCLSLSDWCLVSLPSVSAPSESLVLSAVAILRKWKRVICKPVQWLVMKHELTGKLLPFPCLPFPSLTLPDLTPLYLPSPCPSLVSAPVSPDFGLSHWSEASLAGVMLAQFAVCASVVKSISWWLEQSWIPPKLYLPWIYGDKISLRRWWRQNCQGIAWVINCKCIAASSYLHNVLYRSSSVFP